MNVGRASTQFLASSVLTFKKYSNTCKRGEARIILCEWVTLTGQLRTRRMAGIDEDNRKTGTRTF